MKLLLENWRQYIKENIDLDIEVGDILLGGRYKNKRIVVKEIGEDVLGQPTVNGKPVLKFRIEKNLPDEKKSKKTLEAEKNAINEKDDRCTRIAKSKYDVWPSAYASGAVVRCRKGDIWKDLKEDEDNLQSKIRKALRDEGGAAGMDALKKHTEASAEEIRKAIAIMDDVGRHEDGDYILDDKKHIDIVDESEEGESLHKWFSRKGEKGSGSGWVDCNTCRKDKKTGKKTCKSCGRQKGEKRSKYPACRPTPSACSKRGKWGKKSKKSEGLEVKISEDTINKIIQEELVL